MRIIGVSDLIRYSDQTFEEIKHISENGEEYWFARDLQTVLDYTEWRNFQNVIEKAKEACRNSGTSFSIILLTSTK
jgi:DNA-damage-inducible protein D